MNLQQRENVRTGDRDAKPPHAREESLYIPQSKIASFMWSQKEDAL